MESDIRRVLQELDQDKKVWSRWYCKKTSCTAYSCVRRQKKLEEIETRRLLMQFELELCLQKKKTDLC
jgi:hypothetical protein